MKELQAMIDEGKIEAGRVIAFVKEKSKRTVGRPPVAANERRSAIIQIRVTPAERKMIERAAHKAGLSVSDYLRQLVCGKKTQ